jgi:hypothetical protein
MTESEIADLADRVLRPRLEKHGFERAEAVLGLDHADDPAIFVTARYGPGGDVPSGSELLDASAAIAAAVAAAGDDRPTYLDHRFFHEDLAFEDIDEDETGGVTP